MVHRIDGGSQAAAVPAAGAVVGTPGYFTEGNPGTGTPATIVSQAWTNMVQEELVAIAVAAGLTPAKGTNNQVLAALRTIFGGGIPTSIGTTQTIVAPVWATKAAVQCWGPGGSGGGAFGAAGAGSAGGGGEYREGNVTVTPGASYVCTIGAAGAAGNGTPTNGVAGTATSFGALMTANAGTPGAAGNNGVQSVGGPGGAGGAGGTGFNGFGGGLAFVAGSAISQAVGGGSIGTSSTGPGTATDGNAGNYPGGGGNGGIAGGSGGVGAGGLIKIRWLP